MEVVAKVQLSKIDDNLCEEDDLQPEEIPEPIQEEIRESGAVTVNMKDVKNSLGKDREDWKQSCQNELQSLLDTGSVELVKHVPRGATVFPMTGVHTLKPQPGVTTEKKKSRFCVCGNFQRRKPGDLFYTANADVGSIRIVLHEAAQHAEYELSNMDVATAFLNAYMPEGDDEVIYVKPPRILDIFGLIPPGMYWRLIKAVYGFKDKSTSMGKGT